MTDKTMTLDPSDLVIEVWPQSNGGMKVGVPCGVRVTHKPTGASVTCEHERSGHANRDAALRGIQAAITRHLSQPAERGEAVGEVVDAESDDGYLIPKHARLLNEVARKLPVGTKLYTTPPAERVQDKGEPVADWQRKCPDYPNCPNLSCPCDPSESVPEEIHNSFVVGPSSYMRVRLNQAGFNMARAAFGTQSENDDASVYRAIQAYFYTAPPAERVRVPSADEIYEVVRGFGYTTRGQSDEIAEALHRMFCAAPEATPSPTIDVAAVREVIDGLRCVSRLAGENDLRLRDTCAGTANKLARAIGDAK